MNQAYSLFVWGICAIVGGIVFIFAPPDFFRGYSSSLSPEKKERIISWNRAGGYFFFVMAHLVLIYSFLQAILIGEYIIPSFIGLIFLSELFILFKYDYKMSLTTFTRLAKKALLCLISWLFINTCAFLIFFTDNLWYWFIFLLIQVVVIIWIILYRAYSR